MKKAVLLIISFILVFSLLVSCSSPENAKVTLTFCVMSDIHIGDTNAKESFEKIMTYFSTFETAPEAYLFAGDITNAVGSSKAHSQIVKFKSVFEQFALPSQILFCLGPTHDTPSSGDGKEYRELFETKLGEEYYTDLLQGDALKSEGLRHKTFGGYHFFAIDWDGKNGGNPSSTELSYLDSELASLTAENKDKPVFVIVHVPGNSALATVLSKYPQVVCFTGHLHNSLAREDSINQDSGFTSIHCGGVDYYRVDGYNRFDTNPYLELGNIYDFAQGLYVQVDSENKVTVTRVDGFNGTVIGEKWVVGTSVEKIYTSARKQNYKKCSFDGSDVEITETETALSVAFDACRSGDAGPALYYSVKLLKKGTDGRYSVIETKDIASKQMFYPNDIGIPDLFYKVNFSNADGLGEYALFISAFDCYGESENAIVYSKSGDYSAKLPSSGNINYTYKELTEEEKKVGLITDGEQTVSFKYGTVNTSRFAKNTEMAVRFHPTYQFKNVTLLCSSWGDTKGTLEFKLYKWNGDYAATVAGEPVDSFVLTGFKGSTAYSVTNELHDAGEYLMTVTTPDYGEGVGLYHYTLASGQEKAYVSYTDGKVMDTSIYLSWTNTATCEHPYIVCE